jgi:hypothetical protein
MNKVIIVTNQIGRNGNFCDLYSNLGWVTDSTDWFFRSFPQSFETNFGIVPQNTQDLFLPHPFQIILQFDGTDAVVKHTTHD